MPAGKGEMYFAFPAWMRGCRDSINLAACGAAVLKSFDDRKVNGTASPIHSAGILPKGSPPRSDSPSKFFDHHGEVLRSGAGKGFFEIAMPSEYLPAESKPRLSST